MTLNPIRMMPQPAMTFGNNPNQPPRKPDSQAHFEETEARLTSSQPVKSQGGKVKRPSSFPGMLMAGVVGLLAGAGGLAVVNTVVKGDPSNCDEYRVNARKDMARTQEAALKSKNIKVGPVNFTCQEVEAPAKP